MDDMEISPLFHLSWGAMMFLGTLLSVLFWVSVLAFGIWAVRRFTDRTNTSSEVSPASRASAQDSAMKILQERLARGEINPEEYETIKRTLET